MIKKLFIAIAILHLSIVPALAKRWDYILKDYPNPQEQKIVSDYLNDFHEALKTTWYSPVYRRMNVRSVIFCLNKNGKISDIKIINEFPYQEYYNSHIITYLKTMNYKEFPQCMRQDKIKMGYNFSSNSTPFYMLFGTGGLVVNHGEKLFEYVDKQKEASK